MQLQTIGTILMPFALIGTVLALIFYWEAILVVVGIFYLFYTIGELTSSK